MSEYTMPLEVMLRSEAPELGETPYGAALNLAGQANNMGMIQGIGSSQAAAGVNRQEAGYVGGGSPRDRAAGHISV